MSECPICGHGEAYEWTYTNIICIGCRSLLNETPFGVKLIMKDAAKRFPEILQWWDHRNNLTEEEMRKFGFL